MKPGMGFAGAVAVSCLGLLTGVAQADGGATSDFEFGATGETIFEHTPASLKEPHFGMRFYRDRQVPGTLNPFQNPALPRTDATAMMGNGDHLFWDVAFGERMPIFTWYDVDPDRARDARGLQVNLDAAAFMLLDFGSQSKGVIDTDYRLGGSVDFRPPAGGWDHLSLSIAFFHESTHLGDEYVLSATTIQNGGPPVANPYLPYRANPSYEAFPVTLSVDTPRWRDLSLRAYGGVTKYIDSALPNQSFPSEWRAGAELRWTSVSDGLVSPEGEPSTVKRLIKQAVNNVQRRSRGLHADEPAPPSGRRRRGAFSFEAAYELWARRRYQPSTASGTLSFTPLGGDWYSHHALLLVLYNLDTQRSSSNAVGFSLELIRGQSAFGQLVQYTREDALAGGIEYYW